MSKPQKSWEDMKEKISTHKIMEELWQSNIHEIYDLCTERCLKSFKTNRLVKQE